MSVFGFAVSDQRLLILATLVALAVAGALFFARTDLGLAILGLSQNPLATELMGISAERLSRFTWGVAAVLGGLGGILSAPLASGFGAGFVTLSALIPAFTAAVLGGMTSLPGAFVGGVVVGVAESIAVTYPIFSDHIPGAPSVMVFALLVIVLTVRPRGLLGSPAGDRRPGGASRCERVGADGSPGARSWPAWPALVLVFPLTRSGIEVNVYTEAVIYAIVGLSLNVLLGYAGQISLGHQAFVGIGAFTSAYITTVHEQNFVAAIGVTMMVGARAGAAAGARLAADHRPVLRPRDPHLRDDGREQPVQHRLADRRVGRSGGAEAGGLRQRLPLLLPVPGLPGRRPLRRLAADVDEGRPGAAGHPAGPAGGGQLRRRPQAVHPDRLRRSPASSPRWPGRSWPTTRRRSWPASSSSGWRWSS